MQGGSTAAMIKERWSLGWIGWMVEDTLLLGLGSSCCYRRWNTMKMVNGHNQHWPWLLPVTLQDRRWNTNTSHELAYLVAVH